MSAPSEKKLTIFKFENNRHSNRRKVYLGSTIHYLDKTSYTTCKVRNISETGAMLENISAQWLPHRFYLDIPHHNRYTLAQVVWRSQSLLGVHFEPEEGKKEA